jgi:toxin ParE1/3/4
MKSTRRSIEIAGSAEQDLSAIATWTAEKCGVRQGEIYASAILDAVEELAVSSPPRSKARKEIGADLRTLHMAKPGRRGRHFILYRETQEAVTVLRILHDGMELSRHVPRDGS